MLLNIRIETKTNQSSQITRHTHQKLLSVKENNFQKTRPYLQEVIYTKKFYREHNKNTDSREK